MLTRIISALIGAPLLLLLIYLGGPYTMLLVAALTLLGLREFLLLGERMGMRPWPILTAGISLIWLVTIFSNRTEWLLGILVFWLLIGLGRLALTYPKASLAEVSFNLLAFFYAVVLLSHLYLLCLLPRGVEWTILTIILVWATDTGAYFVGRLFGKRPLAPQISPKKTLEGSLGGFLFSVVVALIIRGLVGEGSWVTYIVLAVIIGVSAQIGDLFESALKRGAGVKDSGKLIPGHGGLLDRFDSLIFVLPLVYYGLLIVNVR